MFFNGIYGNKILTFEEQSIDYPLSLFPADIIFSEIIKACIKFAQ